MSKLLIVHHVQPEFRVGLEKRGTSVDVMMNNIAKHARKVDYDKILFTMWSEHSGCLYHWPVVKEFEYICDFENYDYGWNLDSQLVHYVRDDDNDSIVIDDVGNRYCEGGRHSQFVWIPDWIERYKGYDQVDLCGAFDLECVDDMETLLDFVNIEYNRIEKLIV